MSTRASKPKSAPIFLGEMKILRLFLALQNSSEEFSNHYRNKEAGMNSETVNMVQIIEKVFPLTYTLCLICDSAIFDL